MSQTTETMTGRKELFLGLVHSFQAAAMQQMGKIMNPFTSEVERDLPQARLSIDMLEMLQERTSGNLTGEESRFLTHVLTELRLNYVAEVDEDRKAAAKPEAAAPPTSGASAQPGASAPAAADKGPTP
jgi:Domain of unknown function (DUF1844)